MEVDIVTLTSKGQLVIPQHMREEMDLSDGERMIIVRERNSLMPKPLSKLSSDVEEELLDMKSATRAWEEIAAGKAKRSSKEDFLKELAKW